MAGQRLGWAALVVTAGLAGLVPARPADGEEVKTSPMRIGLTGSLFRDTPDALVQTMMRPFKSLMESQTGISGELVPGIKAGRLGPAAQGRQVAAGGLPGLRVRLGEGEVCPT